MWRYDTHIAYHFKLVLREHRTYALTKIESYGVKEQEHKGDFRQ